MGTRKVECKYVPTQGWKSPRCVSKSNEANGILPLDKMGTQAFAPRLFAAVPIIWKPDLRQCPGPDCYSVPISPDGHPLSQCSSGPFTMFIICSRYSESHLYQWFRRSYMPVSPSISILGMVGCQGMILSVTSPSSSGTASRSSTNRCF